MIKLWEILVPHKFNDGTVISIDHHREWDKRVIQLAGGLTLFKRIKGNWKNTGEIMIPVRVACVREIMKEIMKFTCEHYQQDSVMAYQVSEEVLFEFRKYD
jgi:hypothetical protein